MLRHPAVLLYAALDLAHPLESLVPSSLEFIGYEPVFGVTRIVLSLRTLCTVARRLQLSLQGTQHLVLLLRFFVVGQDRYLGRRRLYHAQHVRCDRRIYLGSTKSNATGQAFIYPTPIAQVAQHRCGPQIMGLRRLGSQ